MPERFALDPLLAADTVPVASFALCAVRLMDDAAYPWLVLVPQRPDLAEIADLAAADRAILIEEIALASHVLRSARPCDKLNIGALGNVVRQLHVHVVGRWVGDPAWPGPVWGAAPRAPYAPEARDAFIHLLRRAIPPAFRVDRHG